MAPGSSAGPEAVSPSPDRPATVETTLPNSNCHDPRGRATRCCAGAIASAPLGIARGRSNSDLRERLRTRLEATAMPRETAPRFDPGVGGSCSPVGYGPILVPRGAGRRTRVFINQYMRRKARDSRAVPASLARRQAPRNRLYACQSAGRSSGSQAAKPIDLCAFSGRLRLACAPRFGGHGRPW